MLVRLALALMIVAFAVMPRIARANDEHAAIDLIRRILQVARENSPASLVLRSSFNTVAIARSILGARWNSASSKERSDFLDALRDAIAENVVRRFGGERSDLVILRSQTLSNGDIIVLTRVKSETSGIVPVDWRVRRYDADLYVVDLSVNGASVVVERREQYDAWLRTNGGPITGLIPIMQVPPVQPQR
ncbi:MAG: ABC transporter substrate-binding protein [Xanthobacteraceae bacterium]